MEFILADAFEFNHAMLGKSPEGFNPFPDAMRGLTPFTQKSFESKGVVLKTYWLVCSESALKRRMYSRGAISDALKLQNWDSWFLSLPRVDSLPARIKVINTTHIRFLEVPGPSYH